MLVIQYKYIFLWCDLFEILVLYIFPAVGLFFASYLLYMFILYYILHRSVLLRTLRHLCIQLKKSLGILALPQMSHQLPAWHQSSLCLLTLPQRSASEFGQASRPDPSYDGSWSIRSCSFRGSLLCQCQRALLDHICGLLGSHIDFFCFAFLFIGHAQVSFQFFVLVALMCISCLELYSCLTKFIP